LGSNATIALGLSDALVTSLAYLLVERAHSEAKHGNTSGGVIYSTSGMLAQPAPGTNGGGDAKVTVMRDVAVASAVCTAVAALTMESFSFGGLGYWGLFGRVLGDTWVFWDGVLGVGWAVGMVGVTAGGYGVLLLLVSGDISLLDPMKGVGCAMIKSANWWWWLFVLIAVTADANTYRCRYNDKVLF